MKDCTCCGTNPDCVSQTCSYLRGIVVGRSRIASKMKRGEGRVGRILRLVSAGVMSVSDGAVKLADVVGSEDWE